MILIDLFEFLMVCIVIYFGMIQLVMPLWNNTKLFPMFRGEGRLANQLTDANQAVLEAELEKEIARKKDEIIKHGFNPEQANDRPSDINRVTNVK